MIERPKPKPPSDQPGSPYAEQDYIFLIGLMAILIEIMALIILKA